MSQRASQDSVEAGTQRAAQPPVQLASITGTQPGRLQLPRETLATAEEQSMGPAQLGTCPQRSTAGLHAVARSMQSMKKGSVQSAQKPPAPQLGQHSSS